jgi:hypothetical protein
LKLIQLEIQLSKVAADRSHIQELINEGNEKLDSITKGKYQINLDNIDTYINDDLKDISRKSSIENEIIDNY